MYKLKPDMDILGEHISFIEKHYKSPVNSIPSNIGWVSGDKSVLSKIYLYREFVESWLNDEGEINHKVFPIT